MHSKHPVLSTGS